MGVGGATCFYLWLEWVCGARLLEGVLWFPFPLGAGAPPARLKSWCGGLNWSNSPLVCIPSPWEMRVALWRV